MNFEKIRKMIAEQIGIDESKITMDSRLIDDLNADSLDIMELGMNIEQEYSIEIPDDVLQNIHTVGDIVNHLDSLK